MTRQISDPCHRWQELIKATEKENDHMILQLGTPKKLYVRMNE